MTTLTFEAELDKETKNALRFGETPVKGQPQISGSLYVQKFAAEQIGEPKRVRVTIEAL